MKERMPLLILDLDECLIHATTQALPFKADAQYISYQVYFRPRLETFLKDAAAFFTLAIWSTGTDAYVKNIVEQFRPKDIAFAFVWGRSKCRRVKDPFFGQTYFYKNLDKLKQHGYDLKRMVMLDDTPSKILSSFAPVVEIAPFEGDPADKELVKIVDTLTAKIC